jgi:hypothetical protein
MADDKRPVQDLGVPKPEVPFRAGGKDQGDLASRKRALSDTGTIGFVPGNSGTGRRSTLRAGGVHEASHPAGRVPGDDELVQARRPMPRQQPVYETPGHTGTLTRYLDGHTEVHRERPELVEAMNHPDTHPDEREDIRQEIAHRDSIHLHKFW